GHVAQGFHVVDRGGLSEQAARGREGGLVPGDGTAAFQRGEQGRFLATDVATGAHVQVDAKVVARVLDVVPEIARLGGFVDGLLQLDPAFRVFAAKKYVGDIRADGIAGN